jgi:hypothetical protein
MSKASGVSMTRASDILWMQNGAAVKGAQFSLSLTDFNDAIILGTWITRGENAIDIDGNITSSSDRNWALAGAVIPFVSGSAINKVRRGAKWLYYSSKYGDNVANAIVRRGNLRKALGIASKCHC